MIIFRGVGLIAAWPISNPIQGFVTLPTPSPPSISMEFGFGVRSKSTTNSAPCVTSGSSPASLITEQSALFFSNSQLLILF